MVILLVVLCAFTYLGVALAAYRWGHRTGRLDEKLARSELMRSPADALEQHHRDIEAITGVHPVSRGPVKYPGLPPWERLT